MTLFAAAPAHAHPADMYFHAHEVHLMPDGLVVHSTIQPGPMLAIGEWYEADTNKNDEVSPEEAASWAKIRIREFACVLDDTDRLQWTVVSVEWPSSMEAMELGDEGIRLRLQAEWPASMRHEKAAAHHLMLHFQHAESLSVNWYYLHGEDGITFDIPDQNNGQLLFAFNTSVDASSMPGQVYWDSGSPTLGLVSDTAQSGQTTNPTSASRSTTILTDLLRTPELSAGLYLGALVITLVLGSIHALTPGHGKALVAAYLIGSRGTLGHAAALGGIVTLTHTGSVLLFGFIALALSHFLLPTEIFPYLELASGLLIAAMGIGLLRPRWRGYRRVARSRKQRRARHVQADPSQETERSSDRPGQRIAINQAIEARPYDALLPDGRLTLASAGEVTWRSLLTLGISGGLVPCPDAIAILLIAIAINRVLLGLGLVVTFSLGMAIVLILIGGAVVRGRLLVSRADLFSRIAPVLPVVSAVVVLGVGLIMIFGAVSRNDMLAAWQSGREQAASSEETTAEFNLDKASIIYMAHNEQEEMQIYLQTLPEGQPKQLSDAVTGVRNYALSPDGKSISYTVAIQEASSIWLMPKLGGKASRIVDCQEAYCSNVLWTPDGARLIYERVEPYSATAVPTLWSYTLESGATRQVFQDSQMPGFGASWSPDGNWLSYLSYPGTPTLELYNLRTGQGDSISSQTGQVATWSPDSKSVLLTKMQSSQGVYSSHLYRYDLETGYLVNLSSGQNVEDMYASWSPDGEWLAVVRRDRSVPDQYSSQIWLMRPDGSDAHPVTPVSDVLHSTPVWSPDSRYLLVQQHGLTADATQPEVWLLDLDSGAYDLLLEEGYWPSWGPGTS
ncbi:MAG: PD40 domain-containing protein [Anaerolineae bacterium]|nr:PD40 domain-containing protein [Anaerolineae bacterium]